MVPLADRMRPLTLADFAGQTHLVGPEGPLTDLIKKGRIPSLILWGPPGSGKTTLARLIARETEADFFSISAVLAGISDLRPIIERDKNQLTLGRKQKILFIDEIHRWNKAQQDALLPHVEKGGVTLIGATTENPSFEVIGPLLSRCRVMILNPLSPEVLKGILQRALKDREHGLGDRTLKIDEETLSRIAENADGDARRALNTLEIAADLAGPSKTLTSSVIEQALQKKALLYDKGGEEHYNTISAFIKSMRASDPQAAVYYLARMYEAGEDPRFIARRMVIFAAEDVGMADPQALALAVSAAEAFDRVGQAEGWIPLSECAVYLAKAPKSRASYDAYKAAKDDLETYGLQPVPMALRNAVTKLMKEAGYGQGNLVQGCLPEKLKGKKYYKE